MSADPPAGRRPAGARPVIGARAPAEPDRADRENAGRESAGRDSAGRDSGQEGALRALGDAELAVDGFLRAAHLATGDDLPRLVTQQAELLGARDALVYLADLQQSLLVPFVGAAGPRTDAQPLPLAIDGTLAGLAYQRTDVLSQRGGAAGETHGHDGVRLWVPLLDGTERVGVLGVLVEQRRAREDPLLRRRLWRFATLVAAVVMRKTRYGDSIVTARRQAPMGLAAEIQWGLLPPLTFACEAVVVAGALEPAYEIAGDSLDYAVDDGIARFAVFDGMGHGLHSAQLASLAVAAYRNGRRGGRSLTATALAIDEVLGSAFPGPAFTTALLAELDTDTGLLSWVNAGHPEPFLLRQGRIVKSLHTAPGLPFGLGLTPEPGPYTVGTERLEPGDQLFLFTDGVIDARSPDGEFFGVERLSDLLARQRAADLSPAETMRRLVRELLAHQQGQLNDDATMLLVEYRSGSQDTLLPPGVPLPPGRTGA